MRLGEEVALYHREPAAPDGHVDVAALAHKLALVVVEAQCHGHTRLVAVDHHIVVAQGGAAVALSAELGELVGDEIHTSGGVEWHAAHHAVAVGQEAWIGYHDAQPNGLDEELVIVGGDKLYLAHDGLDGDVAGDDGGGVALIDLEVDGCHARVGVARRVVALVGASEGDVAQVGGEVVQVGTGGGGIHIVAPSHQAIRARRQDEVEGDGQGVARVEKMGLAGDDAVVARQGLELAAQQRRARCA